MALLGWQRVSRDDPYYEGCLAGSSVGGVAIGATMGSFVVPGIGTFTAGVAGLAIGFAAGYVACPFLAPGLRRKIEGNLQMSAIELNEAAEAMGRYAGVGNASEAIKLVAISKAAPIPQRPPLCRDPRADAQKLLAV